MKKAELVEGRYYITGLRQRIKLLKIRGGTMETMSHAGKVRTTPLTSSILDYMTEAEDQTDNYKQFLPFDK